MNIHFQVNDALLSIEDFELHLWLYLWQVMFFHHQLNHTTKNIYKYTKLINYLIYFLITSRESIFITV